MFTVKVEKKINEIVNRLNKTREQRKPDLQAEREERDREERVERRRRDEEEVCVHIIKVSEMYADLQAIHNYYSQHALSLLGKLHVYYVCPVMRKVVIIW